MNRLRKLFQHRDGFDIYDVVVLAGGALVAYGIWTIYEPACWIIVGCVAFWFGLQGGNKKPTETP